MSFPFFKKSQELTLSYEEFDKIKDAISKLQKENEDLKRGSRYRTLEEEISNLKTSLVFQEEQNRKLHAESSKKDFEITKLNATLSAVLSKLNEALSFVEKSEERKAKNIKISISAEDFLGARYDSRA